ncbi:unnamed protein product [Clonostachys rosea f. rosea IK726]|uniref:Uncharacterized protein n=1 Tax=Clonostachys rosea f. rosea IK726 TaxID=1349383 RepID=A0ACA9UQN1_BIOOC|nr:unnamed protein product [Clonostachys rosea f. rosea IK726]
MRFLKMASKKPTAVSIEDLAIVPTNAQSIVETYKNFNTLSILSLAVSLMATWEGLLSTFGQGLNAAGPVSLVYGFIGTVYLVTLIKFERAYANSVFF